MLEARRRALQRLEQIAQHAQVDVHLVAAAPTRDQPGLLVERGVDEMRYVAHRAEDLGAARRVEEIHRDDLRLLQPLGHTS